MSKLPIVERLEEAGLASVPAELSDFGDMMVEEVIARYRAMIAGEGLTREQQAELLEASTAYALKHRAAKLLHNEAATTITELVSALESASELVKWICERAAKIDLARYLESEGDTGKVNPEIDVLANAQFDGMLASYRDEFDTALSNTRGDTKNDKG